VLIFLLLSAASAVKGELRIRAGYSEAADLFSLMDNVSLWSPNGFNDPEYREYWTRVFDWSEEDQAWADRYRACRERTYADPGQAEQKQALTGRYLETCPGKIDSGFFQLLEEPLAVAFGNAAFAAFVLGAPLAPQENWYWMPTPSVMGRLLWDDVEQLYATDATINDGIIDQAAGYCRKLLQISERMRPMESARKLSND
jgi:hypothetical protein